MRLAANVSMAETEHGAVLLDEAAGRYWQLNRAGADALKIILEGRSEADAARLVGGGDLTSVEEASADVRLLVSALRDAKLVTP